MNAAHNDYLQALVETGAVGFACVVWFIAVLYRQAFKQITNWTHHWDGALRVAALTGCTGSWYIVRSISIYRFPRMLPFFSSYAPFRQTFQHP